MGNRQRILDAALHLFNEKGIEQVSVRDICDDIGISPGNFSYHFPDKSQVAVELHGLLTQEIGEAVAEMPKDKASVYFFLETHRRIFFVQEKYRFFYLNLFEIWTHFPAVRESYRQQYQMEKTLAGQFFELYKAQGVLAASTTEATYKRIIDVGMILNNFWLVDAELNEFPDTKSKLIHYMQLCCGRLEPYLTETSRTEYEAYFLKLEQSEILGN